YRSAVPLTEGVSGDEPESERDAASCGLARNHDPREAPRRHRPPATTSGTCECSNATPRTPMSDGFARRAWGQKTVAVERREASVPRRVACVSELRGDARASDLALRAYVTGPRTGAAQAPQRLSALRFPHFLCGEIGKARRMVCLARTMTRARS